MEVDAERKRIALSMRISDEPGEKKQGSERGGAKRAQNYNKQSQKQSQQTGAGMGSMGALLAQALKK